VDGIKQQKKTSQWSIFFGKTPMATFLESLPLAKKKFLNENFVQEKIQIL
jgi:hypothetical protein